jgi:hypothetical protein
MNGACARGGACQAGSTIERRNSDATPAVRPDPPSLRLGPPIRSYAAVAVRGAVRDRTRWASAAPGG